MNLRESLAAIKSFLKSKNEDFGVDKDNIEFGKFGVMPVQDIFINIYFTIKHVSLLKVFKKNREVIITIFTGVSSDDVLESSVSSQELCEKVIEELAKEFKQIDKVEFGFDSVYSNIAVSYIEFTMFYEK